MAQFKNGIYYLTKTSIVSNLEFRLPSEFFLTLIKEEYNANEVTGLVCEYYENKTVLDEIAPILSKLKHEFVTKYNNATNKELCVNEVKFSYSRFKQENDPKTFEDINDKKIFSYQILGYHDGERGWNHQISTMIDDASQLIEMEEVRINRKEDFRKGDFGILHDKLLNLNRYLEGYTHAHFISWLDKEENELKFGKKIFSIRGHKGMVSDLFRHQFKLTNYQIEQLIKEGIITKHTIDNIHLASDYTPFTFKLGKSIYIATNQLKELLLTRTKGKINEFCSQCFFFENEVNNILKFKCLNNEMRIKELELLFKQKWELVNDIKGQIGYNIGSDLKTYVFDTFCEHIGNFLEQHLVNIYFSNENIKYQNGDFSINKSDWLDVFFASFYELILKPLEQLSQIECNLAFIKDKISELSFAPQTEIISSNRATTSPIMAKLKWKGRPAHLALIIDLLVEKGYLDVSGMGERTAEILLEVFEFEKNSPSKESLGKLLHKDNYPIKDKTVIDKFYKIPNRSELR